MGITTQTPFDRYYQREQISRRQFEAGEKLYASWRSGGCSQRLTSDYDAVVVEESSATLTYGEAFSDYSGILRDFGQDMGKVDMWVCCEGMNASEAATQLNHDPRGRITLLRITLDGLGEIFGMPR